MQSNGIIEALVKMFLPNLVPRDSLLEWEEERDPGDDVGFFPVSVQSELGFILKDGRDNN